MDASQGNLLMPNGTRPENFIDPDIYEAWLNDLRARTGQPAKVKPAKSDGQLLIPLILFALGQDRNLYLEILRHLQRYRGWLGFQAETDTAWNQHLRLLMKYATETVAEFQQEKCGDGQP